MQWWMTRLMSPEGGEGGGGEGGGEGEGAAASVLDTTVEGEGVPSKFAGKTLRQVFEAYAGAERKLHELSTSKGKKAADADAGSAINIGLFKQTLDEAKATGEVPADRRRQIADMLHVPESDVVGILGYVHQQYSNTMDAAQRAIDRNHGPGEGEDGQPKPSGIRVDRLVDWANANYDDEQLKMVNMMITKGQGVPGFEMIIADMRAAGVDPASLQTGSNDRPTLPAPRKGMITEEPRQPTFKSRAEYHAALSAAKGKPEEEAKVQKMLKASNIRAWPDRNVLG